ncbi:hypothetical protein HBE96_20230 [Clostridium sp. P21]|uniref:Lipoprotein n=1 Tax=Clostridium muellerianum TaxID=2716538 RepID=A0A7Y0EK33_9CLOT|nr:hypothetical protein [Clostridium muellerianum]NMM64924.1 hypothetical protein [Clostridium muellerianum]
MRKIICSIFIVAALFICSISLTSCKAITAQNITNTGSSQGMNGGGMNDNKMSNADLIGKIVSVDGNTIKIEVAKQNSNGNKNVNGASSTNGNAASDMNGSQNTNGAPKMNGNQALKGIPNTNGSSSVNSNQANKNNDDRKSPQGGFPGGKLELSYTGETKTITANSDVKISERTGMPGQNENDSLKSSTKISDLKKGQVIMIWYKQNTKTVERISVMQS